MPWNILTASIIHKTPIITRPIRPIPITDVKNEIAVRMISHEPFYKTINEKEISTYKLINTYGISISLIDRLKHNKPISTIAFNDLCTILNCRVDEILLYIPDNDQ